MNRKPPAIILDALLVNDRPTGVGRSILELIRALAVQRREVDFTVLTTEPDQFSWLSPYPGWRVQYCSGARGGTVRKGLFTQFQIPEICQHLGADLLHSLQFVAPLRLPCPSLVTVHDLAWLRFPQTVEEPRRTYYRALVPPTLARARAVVTNSEATARDVRQYFPSCREVLVTPFGTPSWVWRPAENSGSGGFPDLAGRPFFLFVGTLEPRKNLEGILAAYQELLARPLAQGREAWPSLVLVGSQGWRDSKLRRMMEPLLASGDLKVLDYCGTDSLRQLYRSARALLFPSLHEGFGFPILEAMALELPVITSGVGAMAEVAGQTALLVQPRDTHQICEAMARLHEDQNLRCALVQGGRQRAGEWTWQRTARQTLAVYDRILSSPGSDGPGPVD